MKKICTTSGPAIQQLQCKFHASAVMILSFKTGTKMSVNNACSDQTDQG